MLDNIPRRARINLLTPAERAIFEAVKMVEALPPDVRLTDAVVLLQAARYSVADYIDGIDQRRFVADGTSDGGNQFVSGLRGDPVAPRTVNGEARDKEVSSVAAPRSAPATQRPGNEMKLCQICGVVQPCRVHGRTPVTAEDFEELSREVSEALTAQEEQGNERQIFERLSRALTGGNAATWDEVLDAAERLAPATAPHETETNEK